MNNQDLDLEWYAQNVDRLIDFAWDEYKQVTFERYRLQHMIIRNYLWLATVVFSAECVAFSHVLSGSVWFGLPVDANIAFKVFALLAASGSFLTVLCGVDSMRGRRGIAVPFYGKTTIDFAWTVWQEAHDELGKTTMQRDMLEHINKAISHNQEAAMRKGKRLRCMSYLLLASMVFALFSLMSALC